MSKIYEQYIKLKQQNVDNMYLFKIGIFYLFIDDDAKKANTLFELKCTHLNDKILKCGFPIDSLDKYLKKFEQNNLKVKIIDKILIQDDRNYLKNTKIEKILKKIKKQDIDKMNGITALNLLNELKELL